MTKPRTHSHRHRKRAPILESGDTLDDDLRVIEHLGGSRKVDIYLCRSRRLGDLVACKVLRPEHRIDYACLEAIREEGEILERLNHPHVIEGYGAELTGHPRVAFGCRPLQSLAEP